MILQPFFTRFSHSDAFHADKVFVGGFVWHRVLATARYGRLFVLQPDQIGD